LADAVVAGRPVLIRLEARKFFYTVSACMRKIFTEQVPGLTARYGPASLLLRGMREAIGL
jgi:hypothetical protein